MGKSWEITFSLRGQLPRPWGTNEWEWRQAIADVARERVKGLYMEDPPEDSHFEVEITFYLPQPTFSQADLDNLAKPVLDTLFHAKYPQTRREGITGVLLRDIDDDHVVALALRKQLVDNKEQAGADISVWTVD